MAKTILIIDDQKDLCQAIKLPLSFEGYRCLDFQTAPPFIQFLEKETAHAALLDLNLGDGQMSGMELIEKIKKLDPHLPIIVLTGDSSIKAAVAAIKAGAFHYLTKPFDNEELLVLVKKAVEEREKSRAVELLKARTALHKIPNVIGKSPAISETIELANKIASTELTVLLEGESGAGKELFAALIHSKSLRKDGPYVSLDCGTLQETLVESELFGYEKGAFTGAEKRKLGLFEIASGGSIFLDEISNLSLTVQAKLLRVLQERKIQHLGGNRDIEIDIRVIVACNRSLEGMVEEGKFREDLFHRLNEFKLIIPALRKRIEDIPELATNFLALANQEMNKNVVSFSNDAIHLMQSYAWPGNIRELKNAVYRAALLAETEIKPEHLQISLSKDRIIEKSFLDLESGKKFSLKKASKQASSILEKQMIEQTLKKCKYNKTLAAKQLKIDRKALYNKLKKYKILDD